MSPVVMAEIQRRAAVYHRSLSEEAAFLIDQALAALAAYDGAAPQESAEHTSRSSSDLLP